MKLLILLLATFGALSCGFKPSKKKKDILTETPIQDKQASSKDQSEVYPSCNHIVANGIYGDKLYEKDLLAKTFLVNLACDIFANQFEKSPEKWDEPCRPIKDESTNTFELDKIIGIIPVGATDEYRQGNPTGYCKDAKTRRSYLKVWHQNMCKGYVANSQDPVITDHMILQLNSKTVDDWKSCLSKSKVGLICATRKVEDRFELKLSYNLPTIESDQIKIDFQHEGIKAANELPSILSSEETPLAFIFESPNTPSSLKVTAYSSGQGVNSCTIKLPPQELRSCEGGNLVGSHSKAIYLTNSMICKELDKCEINRLRAVFEGKIKWEMYQALIEDNATVYFFDDGRIATNICE